MKINFKIQWSIEEQELDPRLLKLLDKINLTASLQAAANDIGVSYRTAWEIIRHWNEAFNTPLCTLKRGKGSSLTALGQKLLQSKYELESRYAESLNNSSNLLNNEIYDLIGEKNNKKKLVAFTSDDLSINFLKDLCEEKKSINVDFHARGSLDALKQLQSSKYNIAGFHFPNGNLAKQLAPEYRGLLNDEKYIFIHLVTRQQGLIFKQTLSDHIKDINSLTRRSIKFINRQQGSGTRAIFDQLVKLKNISKKNISGYKKEEFTHTAVAAMISSGHADVGFGIKAAAVQFKLSFLPLVSESYIIAINKELPKEIKDKFRSLIKDQKLRKRINKLAGYDTKLTGKIIHADKLLSDTS